MLLGHLSPTGTYGYSIITNNSTGWFGTVKDDHVVDAASYEARTVDTNSIDRNADVSIQTIFMECLRTCVRYVLPFVLERIIVLSRPLNSLVHGYTISDEKIESLRLEVDQLRSTTWTVAGGVSDENEDMQTLKEDAVRMKQDELDRMYADHSLVKLASNIFEKEDPSSKMKRDRKFKRYGPRKTPETNKKKR